MCIGRTLTLILTLTLMYTGKVLNSQLSTINISEYVLLEKCITAHFQLSFESHHFYLEKSVKVSDALFLVIHHKEDIYTVHFKITFHLPVFYTHIHTHLYF